MVNQNARAWAAIAARWLSALILSFSFAASAYAAPDSPVEDEFIGNSESVDEYLTSLYTPKIEHVQCPFCKGWNTGNGDWEGYNGALDPDVWGCYDCYRSWYTYEDGSSGPEVTDKNTIRRQSIHTGTTKTRPTAAGACMKTEG